VAYIGGSLSSDKKVGHEWHSTLYRLVVDVPWRTLRAFLVGRKAVSHFHWAENRSFGWLGRMEKMHRANFKATQKLALEECSILLFFWDRHWRAQIGGFVCGKRGRKGESSLFRRAK
jgi:hypothetical protein